MENCFASGKTKSENRICRARGEIDEGPIQASKAAELDAQKNSSKGLGKSSISNNANVKCKKSENEILLRRKALDATKCLASIKRDSKWNKIMVDWVKQQHPVIGSRKLLNLPAAREVTKLMYPVGCELCRQLPKLI